MSKLNPIEESEFIEKEFREYLKDTFDFSDLEYKNAFAEELNRQSLYKGPYLSVSLPFESSNSINDLIEQGKVSKLFKNLSGIDFDQKLYVHQEQSLNKICDGHSVVITTGTGSGKTESFLYPILNSIMKDIEKGDNGPGIRAILLYPMNALVNDQIDRVRSILANYPEIRFGFFTGETPEKDSSDLRKKLSEEAGVEIPKNEAVCRQDIRDNPPHLLFSNYSMLEFLLIRPNDFKIFNPEYLKYWKFVVLDEAHTYNGALGIEVSLLLRRLTGLSEKKPQFILTSATLGQKGRDEKEIIHFAKSLTSVEYNEDDIIFSTRRSLNKKNIKYDVDPRYYSEIDENLDNLKLVKEIINNFTTSNSDDVNEILYDFLVNDSNVYYLYDILSLENLQFKEAIELLRHKGFTQNKDLVSLIHLINLARKDKKNLYDIKYHTFIRTLSGAYVTISPKKELRLATTYNINNLKTFELGTCRYCNATYLFGKEIDGYLRQNSDIDIYENYGDNENINVDYYLLVNSENEEFNKSMCEERVLCGNCGFIYDPANKNARKCDCDEDYKKTIYKVTSNTQRNNITRCPSCTHHSNNGIVRSVNLGKDEATAILGQILYKAIDDNEVQIEVENKGISFSKANLNEETKKDPYVKQFITFSDSRQQASFFATFFDANHERFLRKRMIWKVIEDNNYESIKFDSLVSKLDSLISKYNLFPDNKLTNNKQAWITALHELLSIDGNYGAEGLGLFQFNLDLNSIGFDELREEDIAETFGKYNINKKDLLNIINVLFNIFRITPAIEYTSSGLTPEEKKDYLSFRRFDNFVKLKKNISSKSDDEEDFNRDGNIKSLLPVNSNKPNNYIDYIMRVAKCNFDEAVEIISIIYKVIGEDGGLFEKSSKINDQVYQISSSKYILNNYKNSKYYQCSKCGKLTSYNVHNVCPTKECHGVLSECDPDNVLQGNYYRKEYKNKKIESINIKEHTAQLSRASGKEYQKRFKAKEINILSCSTTFEMGVDIGGLETVFMRNVPPSPANYVQRAGRAGRRNDSSAFVLTFCNSTSHDYTYFDDPGKMIAGIIKPPKFSITNEKIILRHLVATAFGFFFRSNENYFENIDNLVCNGGIDEFKKYLNSHPSDLNDFINKKILDDSIYDIYNNYKWLDLLEKNGNYLDNFNKNINDLIDQFTNAMEDAKADNKFDKASYYQGQIARIKKDRVIDKLSKYNVIPKYGFPVDVVELEIWKDGEKDKKYDLDRDLSIAISEYAPDSEIIVDKEKFTSKYISLPKTNEFTKYYYYTCDGCERENVSEFQEKLNKCVYCGAENDEKPTDYFIEPIYGFKTGYTKESTTRKPKKSYAGSTSYIGNGVKDANSLSIGENNLINIQTSSDDELLVMNTNPFFMCKTCGYSKIDKACAGYEYIIEEHLNYKGRKCNDSNLYSIALGHKFKTDVAKISIDGLEDKSKAVSILYALLEGISVEFSIERKDIDGLVVKNGKGDYDLIIYDNVPGGAGHVKRIVDKKLLKETFESAKKKVEQNCCDENTSCYNCLRNYNNQRYHKILKRKLALEEIEYILLNID